MTPFADLARRYRFNERLLAVESEGFTPEDWACAPGPRGGNCAHWILGHVAQARRMIARRLGAALPEEPWERRFGMNSRPDGSPLAPGPDFLVPDFAASGVLLEERLGALSEEAGRARWGARRFPDGSESLGDVLVFLHFHETYHLGQIGLLRRILGKPGFA